MQKINVKKRMSVYKKVSRYLKKNEIPYEELEHEPAASAEDYHRIIGLKFEQQVKTHLMIVKKGAKESFALVAIQAKKEVDLEIVRILLQADSVEIAGREKTKEVIGCGIGEIPAVAGLFKMPFLFDRDFLVEKKIFFNAGRLDVTFAIDPQKLVEFEKPILFEQGASGSSVKALVQKTKETSETALVEKMRHSCSHVLAMAVLKFHPDAKLGIGPAIENGFYYDFKFAEPITEEDLPQIENEMKRIIAQDYPISQEIKSREEAEKYYRNWEQDYKLDLLKEIPDKELSFYSIGGKEFTDLCRGPHVESTGKIGAIKLTKIAGAYWRGDEKNDMLTRIYGLAFETEKELQNQLNVMEEAEKRNHRKIGKELELFAIFPEIGQGLPVWLPNGYVMRRVLEDYMLKMERRAGYSHCLTPNINRGELFKISGHLDFYKDSMYSPMKIEDDEYYLKPMNCPANMMIYKMKTRSYRDLPIKLGELGTVYRFEKSGELQGLQRVRGFTQNDAHIFCTPEQLEQQFMEVFSMLLRFLKDIGFKNYRFRLSLSDPDAEKYKFCGKREDWVVAENMLREVLVRNEVEFYEAPGEAAFYGPKLDVQAINVFGKEDSISTIQVDFNLPERFDINYVDKDGTKKRPFIIHRALIGSFERFFAFLIEYYGGAFPLWISPEQVRVIPISEKHINYANEVNDRLLDLGVRSSADTNDDMLQAKIRSAEVAKVNYTLVVGDKEIENKTVSVRPRGGKNIGMILIDDFIEMLVREIRSKGEYIVGSALPDKLDLTQKDVS